MKLNEMTDAQKVEFTEAAHQLQFVSHTRERINTLEKQNKDMHEKLRIHEHYMSMTAALVNPYRNEFPGKNTSEGGVVEKGLYALQMEAEASIKRLQEEPAKFEDIDTEDDFTGEPCVDQKSPCREELIGRPQ